MLLFPSSSSMSIMERNKNCSKLSLYVRGLKVLGCLLNVKRTEFNGKMNQRAFVEVYDSFTCIVCCYYPTIRKFLNCLSCVFCHCQSLFFSLHSADLICKVFICSQQTKTFILASFIFLTF